MRQAIRVYAIVALAVAVPLLVIWWRLPPRLAQQSSWTTVLDLVVGAQLWVSLAIPLGVLAASDAAHAGRRGWLAAFIVLIVLAPIAARIGSLIAGIQGMLDPSCLGGTCIPAELSQPLYLTGWTVALLPVLLAALIYTIVPAPSAPRASPYVDSRERRVIVVCAIVGFVVMGVLGFLVNSDFILTHFGSGTVAHIEFIGALRYLLDGVWFTLLDALTVAVATLALAHTFWLRQRGWLAGWIAVIVLAMLVANVFVLAATVLISSPNSVVARGLASLQPQIQVVSAVVPVVVMLVALIYAVTTRPGRPHAAALAG